MALDKPWGLNNKKVRYKEMAEDKNLSQKVRDKYKTLPQTKLYYYKDTFVDDRGTEREYSVFCVLVNNIEIRLRASDVTAKRLLEDYFSSMAYVE